MDSAKNTIQYQPTSSPCVCVAILTLAESSLQRGTGGLVLFMKGQVNGICKKYSWRLRAKTEKL